MRASSTASASASPFSFSHRGASGSSGKSFWLAAAAAEASSSSLASAESSSSSSLAKMDDSALGFSLMREAARLASKVSWDCLTFCISSKIRRVRSLRTAAVGGRTQLRSWRNLFASRKYLRAAHAAPKVSNKAATR
eukprot:scaffold115_cov241-Pinguiococcus_pyrenoidosus.AAC.20